MNDLNSRHLLTLEGLSAQRIHAILDRAEALRDLTATSKRNLDILEGRNIVQLFFEPSTRTRVSFELAAKKLGANVINFDCAGSSVVKGESLLDTVHTLEAMQSDALIMRHQQDGMAQYVAENLRSPCAVINAGDGRHAHPTQGLLDALTIRRHFADFSRLCVLICGDILHSRVARSDIHVLRTLGVRELRLCAPQALLPETNEQNAFKVYTDFDKALADVDVVIMLRLQKERMQSALIPSSDHYFQSYGLTEERLARAKPHCIVMHPGPINREVEIASKVADGPRSVILEQVQNGVFVRMAVLSDLLKVS